MVVFVICTESSSAPSSGPKKTTSCPLCRKQHVLRKCKEFFKLKRFKRISVLISKRRCFWCLVRKHFIRKCKSVDGCAVAGFADPQHHTLLQKKVETRNADEEIVCSDTEKGYSKRLYFIPVSVRVNFCGRELLIYAMLDTGSQRIFCRAGLAKRLQSNGIRRSFPICILSTEQRAEVTDYVMISLTVKGIEKKQSIDL